MTTEQRKKIGRMGGSAPYKGKKGFAAMPRAKMSAAGRKGGQISRKPKAPARILDVLSVEELFGAEAPKHSSWFNRLSFWRKT